MLVLMASTVMIVMNVSFNGQYGHDSQDGHNDHNKLFAPKQVRKGLILLGDLFAGRHPNGDGPRDAFLPPWQRKHMVYRELV